MKREYFSAKVLVGNGRAVLGAIDGNLGAIVSKLSLDQILAIPKLVVDAYGAHSKVEAEITDVDSSVINADLFLFSDAAGSHISVVI
jgi:hypothetical protein